MNMLEKTASLLQRGKREALLWQIGGPVSLLCTLSLAAFPLARFDLLFVALAGLYLSARWQIIGSVYALVLLTLSALVHHFLIEESHFWQLGLEISMACAFLITALSFEHSVSEEKALSSQLKAKEGAIQNLEEDLAKEREGSTATRIEAQEKISGLQKELEEIQAQESSLEMLNEVLRKTSARQLEEKHFAEEKNQETHRHIAALQFELYTAKAELQRLKQSDAMAQENGRLQTLLNAARVEKEQAHLINETFSRPQEEGRLRASDAEQKLQPVLQEKLRLEELLVKAQSDLDTRNQEREEHVLRLRLLQELQTEMALLQRRLQTAQREAQFHKDHPEQLALREKERAQYAEELQAAQEKAAALVHTDALYKQLKKQFEEKNQILHQTRQELFHATTALETVQREKDLKEGVLDPISTEVVYEMDGLEQEISFLSKENEELMEIVTHLSSAEDLSRRKKKVKTMSDQELLF